MFGRVLVSVSLLCPGVSTTVESSKKCHGGNVLVVDECTVGSMANTTSKPSTTTPASNIPRHGNTTILIRGQLHGDHEEAANAVVSLILVIMVGFVVFMTIFFWRKYKHITLSVPAYQYSRLSQTEGGDLTEVIDQLGLSVGNSSTDDEMEPATLPVSTTQYPCNQNHGQGQVANGKVAKLSNALLDDSDEELLQ